MVGRASPGSQSLRLSRRRGTGSAARCLTVDPGLGFESGDLGSQLLAFELEIGGLALEFGDGVGLLGCRPAVNFRLSRLFLEQTDRVFENAARRAPEIADIFGEASLEDPQRLAGGQLFHAIPGPQ